MRKYIMEALGTFFIVLAIGISGDPLAIGLIYASVVYVGFHISGSHFNPAITFAFLLLNKINVRRALLYIISQAAGSFLAAAALIVFSSQVYFVEAPTNTYLYQQVSAEFLFTFLLVLVVITVFNTEQLLSNNLYGFIVGLMLTGITFLGLPISGGIFNPAVSIGVSVVDLLNGGLSFYFIPLYTLAPLTGAAAAAWLYVYLNDN